MHLLICLIDGCVVEPNVGSKNGWNCGIPVGVLYIFKQRQTYMPVGEAFGPVLALWLGTHFMADIDLTFYIDNMAVLCDLVLGSSRQQDFASIYWWSHFRLGQLGCTGW